MLRIQDLLVVSMPSPDQGTALERWDGMLEHFFVPEACAHWTLVGHKDALATIPQRVLDYKKEVEEKLTGAGKTDAGTVHILSGVDAYAKLVCIATGIDDVRFGDNITLVEMKRNWEKYKRFVPEKSAELEEIIQKVFHDQKIIRTSILEEMRTVSKKPAVSARELAGIKKSKDKNSSRALLICGNRLGTATDTAQAIGNHVAEIVVTHFDVTKLEEAYAAINELKEKGKIKAVIRMESLYEVMSEGFGLMDNVFVCCQMAIHEKLDETILRGWIERKRQDGHIALLRGDADNRGQSIELWTMAKSDDHRIILPEDIAAHTEANRAFNVDVERRARIAAKNCAITRERSNKLPVAEIIDKEDLYWPLFMARKSGNGKGPEIVK